LVNNAVVHGPVMVSVVSDCTLPPKISGDGKMLHSDMIVT